MRWIDLQDPLRATIEDKILPTVWTSREGDSESTAEDRGLGVVGMLFRIRTSKAGAIFSIQRWTSVAAVEATHELYQTRGMQRFPSSWMGGCDEIESWARMRRCGHASARWPACGQSVWNVTAAPCALVSMPRPHIRGHIAPSSSLRRLLAPPSQHEGAAAAARHPPGVLLSTSNPRCATSTSCMSRHGHGCSGS